MKKLSKLIPSMFSLLVMITFLPSFEDQSTKVDNNSQDLLSYSNLIAALVVTPIGGLVVYLLKRSFVNKDFESQKKIEHQNWLYEQFNPLAMDYYVPLAKFAFDASNSIKNAVAVNDQDTVKIAYHHIVLFLSKYIDFKNSKGANFLFKTRKLEIEAIIATRAVLNSLPFNDLDIATIHKKVQKDISMTRIFSGDEYHIFNTWLTNGNCRLSVDLIERKLNYLQKILDTGSEETAHPELFDDSDLVKKIIPPIPDYDPFFIISSNTKYVQRGEEVVIFGEGFENRYVEYRFLLNDNVLEILRRDNTEIHLRIPATMPAGTYDIFAQFNVSRYGGVDLNQTIGIPITVSN